MFEVERIQERFRDTSSLASDDRVVCKATFEQFCSVSEPYVVGETIQIFVNEEKVGSILFSEDPNEPKSKSVQIDVTDHLTGALNTIRVQTVVDRNFASEGFHSEADFRIRVKGQLLVKEHYETRLPLRLVSDAWVV